VLGRCWQMLPRCHTTPEAPSGVGGKERDRSGDFFRLAEPLRRDLLKQGLGEFLGVGLGKTELAGIDRILEQSIASSNNLECDRVHIDSAELRVASLLGFEIKRGHSHVKLAFGSRIGSG
jgi:hypothetical protein